MTEYKLTAQMLRKLQSFYHKAKLDCRGCLLPLKTGDTVVSVTRGRHKRVQYHKRRLEKQYV